MHHPASIGRRSFLKVGVLGGLGAGSGSCLGFTLQDLLEHAPTAPRATSVIHIFLPGGMAHQETFDPKPYAPIEYRGSTKAIKTAIDGVQFSNRLPRLATIADKMTIIRSFSHGEAAHERGVHNMFTGYRPSPSLVFPSMGSIVSHELGSQNDLPSYVCVPNQPNTFAGSGYLSSSFAPFSLGSDPANKNFEVRDLNLPGGVTEERFTRRRRMLDAVNDHFRAREASDELDAMDSFYHHAYDLLSSHEARAAFDLTKETDVMKDKYGRTQAGMRMLLGRRLVEAGVRFVSMTYGSWDMHRDIDASMNSQLPSLDQALAALINDLDQRGLLDSTLVLLTTEFGRTPRLNAEGGRDHWPRVFSIAMAGGGVKRGFVLGASDPTATEVEDTKVGPEDLAHTVFSLLGIDPHKRLIAPGNRPIDIARHGRLLDEILA